MALLQARRPRFRTPVGPDAHVMRVAGRLPARWRHRFVRRASGLRDVDAAVAAGGAAAGRAAAGDPATGTHH